MNTENNNNLAVLRLNQLKNDSWEELRKTRFSEFNEEQLEFLKIMWMHGFSKGIEIFTQVSMENNTIKN